MFLHYVTLNKQNILPEVLSGFVASDKYIFNIFNMSQSFPELLLTVKLGKEGPGSVRIIVVTSTSA
jgi:hypothetical protein